MNAIPGRRIVPVSRICRGGRGSGAREKAEEEEERSAITNNKFRKRRKPSLPPGALKIPESGLERLVCEFTR